MIIVEGPDGAGKTTLISQMSAELHLPVAARVVSKDTEAMVDINRWVDHNLAKGFHDMIYDRHRLISEPTYGPILRSTAQPGFDDLTWLRPRMTKFYALHPIIIYCLPPLETVLRNVERDPDNRVVQKHIQQIYSVYVTRAAIDGTHPDLNVRIWDYTTHQDPAATYYWIQSIGRLIEQRRR